MLRAGENPFRVERIHRLEYQLDGETWNAVLARLAAMNYRAAILGEHGHGKSTFLHTLAGELTARGFGLRRLFLNEENPRFDPAFLRALHRDLKQDEIVLLDGAEQLGYIAWRRFLRAVQPARGVVITRHRAGHFPALYTCRTSPELLASLLRALDAETHLPDGVSPEQILARHQGSIRDVFFSLYDRLARESKE